MWTQSLSRLSVLILSLLSITHSLGSDPALRELVDDTLHASEVLSRALERLGDDDAAKDESLIGSVAARSDRLAGLLERALEQLIAMAPPGAASAETDDRPGQKDSPGSGLSKYARATGRALTTALCTQCAVPMRGHGVDHAGRSPAVGPVFTTPGKGGGSPAVLWQRPINKTVAATVSIDNEGSLYFGDWQGRFHKLRADGTSKWNFEAGRVIVSTAAIGGDGTLYVGSWDTHLYALDANDGKLKWKYTEQDMREISSSPAIGWDGTIYFSSGNNYTYALNPDGSFKWKIAADGPIFSSPAIGPDSTIYIGSRDKHLHAISPCGTLKWKFEANGEVDTSPAVGGDGTIYIGSWSGYAYAVTPEGGMRWKRFCGAKLIASPAIAHDGTVYFGSHDGGLYALRPHDGTVRWIFWAERSIEGSPTIGADGTVYVASWDGNLYAISSGGILRWKHDVGHTSATPSIGLDGVLYIASLDGQLFAFADAPEDAWVNETTVPTRNDTCSMSLAVRADEIESERLAAILLLNHRNHAVFKFPDTPPVCAPTLALPTPVSSCRDPISPWAPAGMNLTTQRLDVNATANMSARDVASHELWMEMLSQDFARYPLVVRTGEERAMLAVALDADKTTMEGDFTLRRRYWFKRLRKEQGAWVQKQLRGMVGAHDSFCDGPAWSTSGEPVCSSRKTEYCAGGHVLRGVWPVNFDAASSMDEQTWFESWAARLSVATSE